jgi:myosin heavy subunit
MQTAKIAAQTKQISAASNSGALGFLALSQAVEDAQYGLRGVLNNIPMMVMGFGGGPGLAGAISLAAVALSMLWPELEKVTGKQARKQIEDGAKAFRESWRAAIADVKKEVADVAREKRFSGAFDRFEQATTMGFSIGSAAPMIAFYDKQLEKRKALRDTEREITEARIGLMRASGVSSEGAQRASEAEAVAERLADAAIKQKQISQALVAGRRISGDSRETVAALRKDLEASEAEMVLLKYKLARSKADAERLAAMQKVGDVNAQVGVNLRLSANKAPALENELADEVARQEMLRKKIELTEKTARESIDTLHQTVQARTDEITALKAEAAKLEELNKIRGKEREIIRQRDALENARRYGEEQARKAEEFRQEKERAAEVRRKEAEVKARQADFAAEFIAAKMRATGRAGMADALEKEIALRREAKDLAESLNIHEQWALTLLRRKAEMLERAAGGPGEARRARREIGYGASRLQGREGFLNGSASLRNAEMERRNRRAAADAAQSRKDPAAAYWERQLDLQQQLVKHFEKLGAA